jgi:hypothetical protein
MSKYRATEEERTVIEIVRAGCPLCHSDVKGDDVYLFYCKNCNILFKRNELALEGKEHVTAVLKEKVAEKYTQDKNKLKIEDEHIPLKEVKIKLEKPEKFIASKSSNILHVANCPFAKNIKKENRKIFKSLEEAEGYKRCKCI